MWKHYNSNSFSLSTITIEGKGKERNAEEWLLEEDEVRTKSHKQLKTNRGLLRKAPGGDHSNKT